MIERQLIFAQKSHQKAKTERKVSSAKLCFKECYILYLHGLHILCCMIDMYDNESDNKNVQ